MDIKARDSKNLNLMKQWHRLKSNAMDSRFEVFAAKYIPQICGQVLVWCHTRALHFISSVKIGSLKSLALSTTFLPKDHTAKFYQKKL